MNRIKKLQDIIDWRMCTGCGICSHINGSDVIKMINIEEIGIRPVILDPDKVDDKKSLSVCPGFKMESIPEKKSEQSLLIGPYMEIWEGFASDEQIRTTGSSGALLSALACYCIEKEGMSLVLHTGQDPESPWQNITVTSRNRQEILNHVGSRYAPSSPCDSLNRILENEGQSVFIGKPCDAAAVAMLRKVNPELDRKLGLVLSFFCAGTPSTKGVTTFLKQNQIPVEKIKGMKYRGDGWPGNLTVKLEDGTVFDSKTYEESWNFLSGFRPIRCQLCPDGLGEFSDISCGDAWHKLERSNKGLSLAIARTLKGKEILERASEAGYITLSPSTHEDVVMAQGLIRRRKELYGRLLSFKSLLIPVTDIKGFGLKEIWRTNTPAIKASSLFGTYKRILFRHYWRKKNREKK